MNTSDNLKAISEPQFTINAGFRPVSLFHMRWLMLAAQIIFVAINIIDYGISLSAVMACGVIILGILVNWISSLKSPYLRWISQARLSSQLTFDLILIAALIILINAPLGLTPLLYFVPLGIGALSLPRKQSISLTLFACVLFLLNLLLLVPSLLTPATASDLIGHFLVFAFIAFAQWLGLNRLMEDQARRTDVLVAAQSALDDERRLAALGSLATAAAHELGTPLGTITLAAREMMSGMDQDTPYREELEVIVQEALRCREILKRLSSTHADEREDMLRRLPVEAIVREAIDQHGSGVDRDVTLNLQPMEDGVGDEQPMMSNRSEIVHGLGNFIENAIGYSREAVEVLISWNHDVVRVSILDDGPGFDAAVVDKLGQPYISTRGHDDDYVEESGAGGLGLGVYIAKTLIERTGGQVSFHNGLMGGAQIDVIWPRAVFEESHKNEKNIGGFPEALF